MAEWKARRFTLPLDRTRVMGVVNVTPDSFSDGGRFLDVDAAVAHGLRLVREGADILDVGGESTRPGAEPVSVTEEQRRVVPVIERLAKDAGVPVSVDTRRAAVAETALAAGAAAVNDVSGGTYDPAMLPLVARQGAGVVLMHMRGHDPRTMQQDVRYDDVVAAVRMHFARQARAARDAGVPREAIVLDPGIGFGKTLAHNLALLRRVNEYALGYPVLVGASRKSTIGKLTRDADGAMPPADDRVEGSIAAHVLAAAHGAAVVRVHDVKETVRALAVADAIEGKVVPDE